MLCRTSLGKCVMAFVSLAAALLTLEPLTALAQGKELKIGVQYGLGYLPLYVARDAGLLDKHMKAQGLEPVTMRIVNFTGGPQIQDGLLSQSLASGFPTHGLYRIGHGTGRRCQLAEGASHHDHIRSGDGVIERLDRVVKALP